MKREIIVVKLGGETLDNEGNLIEDIVKLQKEGFSLVLIHGGGKDINKWLEKFDVLPRFEHGLRVTDPVTLDIATAVLCGLLNKKLVASVIRAGGRAVGVSGVDGCLIKAKIENEKLGFTGEYLEVNDELLSCLLSYNYIPIIAPISLNKEDRYDQITKLINVNGDTVAANVASSLGASRLIFLTDVEGLFDNQGKIISEITCEEVIKLVQQGVITGGMSVKVKSCISALSRVKITRIINGKNEHALYEEIHNNIRGTTIIGRIK